MRIAPAFLPPAFILASIVLPTPEIATKMADPAVRIESGRSIGSGTHIGHGRILTAAHVVTKDGGILEVSDQDGNVYPASITFIDEDSDVAVIQIETSPKIKSLDPACRKPLFGEAIYTVGNPMGDPFVGSWGRVSSKLPKYKRTVEVFSMDMTTIPGMSGGGVIDWKGYVIGIVSMVMVQPMLGTPLHVGYAVPSSVFCPMLKEAGVM
jgi:S1-C subfamily serine protease